MAVSVRHVRYPHTTEGNKNLDNMHTFDKCTNIKKNKKLIT